MPRGRAPDSFRAASMPNQTRTTRVRGCNAFHHLVVGGDRRTWNRSLGQAVDKGQPTPGDGQRVPPHLQQRVAGGDWWCCRAKAKDYRQICAMQEWTRGRPDGSDPVLILAENCGTRVFRDWAFNWMEWTPAGDPVSCLCCNTITLICCIGFLRLRFRFFDRPIVMLMGSPSRESSLGAALEPVFVAKVGLWRTREWRTWELWSQLMAPLLFLRFAATQHEHSWTLQRSAC